MKHTNFLNPAKFPFFYGYFIALLGTIGIWASIPGQTVGVSTFTDPVKDTLGLTRNQFSFAYMLGTLASSLLISRAGRWFDKYGAQLVAAGASFLLSISLFLASWSQPITSTIQSLFNYHHWIIPFTVMVILFFLFRFSGQGVLTMSSRNMIMKWFERFRGRVNAFSALSISLGFSIAPVIIDKLITSQGWSGAWRIMGVGLLVMTFLIILFYRDSPEKHGLKPDGVPPKSDCKALESKALKNFEPQQAFKSRAFWMYALMLAFNSFFITGFTFHVVSIFEDAGFARSQAISVFIPISIVSVSFSLVFNFISDWVKLKGILYVMIGGGFLASLGLAMLHTDCGLYLIILGAGILGGLFSVLNAIAWPRLFGRKFIGTISGKAMSMIVFASALAPFLFSQSFSLFKSYSGVAWLAFCFMVFIAVASVKADNPRLPNKQI